MSRSGPRAEPGHPAAQRRVPGLRTSDLLERDEQFGIKDCSTSRTSYDVVAEHGHLPVEDRIGSDPSDDRRHPARDIAVETRLRPIRFVAHDDRPIRRRRQAQLLRQARPGRQRVANVINLCLVAQRKPDRLEVAVLDVHAIALCAHPEVGRRNSVADERAEQLSGLLLELLFLCLLYTSSSDWLFPPATVRTLTNRLARAGVDAGYAELETNHGHDGFLVEEAHLAGLVTDFLSR